MGFLVSQEANCDQQGRANERPSFYEDARPQWSKSPGVEVEPLSACKALTRVQGFLGVASEEGVKIVESTFCFLFSVSYLV